MSLYETIDQIKNIQPSLDWYEQNKTLLKLTKPLEMQEALSLLKILTPFNINTIAKNNNFELTQNNEETIIYTRQKDNLVLFLFKKTNELGVTFTIYDTTIIISKTNNENININIQHALLNNETSNYYKNITLSITKNQITNYEYFINNHKYSHNI